jgi:hypothetical protein
MDASQQLARYKFDTFFRRDPATNYLVPQFNISVNGSLYPEGRAIMPGLTFGGLNLYNYTGRDLAGVWNPRSRILDFKGFYK